MKKIVHPPKPKSFSLQEIVERRKKVLIFRDRGGLGDLFMLRMIFEDFKLLLPDVHITFACPKQYMDAVVDHPFVDEIVDLTVNKEDFLLVYDVSQACNRYELETSPHVDKHRSDIWAESCGVFLTKHDMHFRLSEKEIEFGKNILGENSVLIAPISAMEGKNLLEHQIQPVIDELKKRYKVYAIHTGPVPYDVETIFGINIREYLGIINAANYVISVDTSVLHCAGGMGKPVVGVFSFADGKVYGKYYKRMTLVQRHRDYTPGWDCGPCYNFGLCPKVTGPELRKPCITEITAEDVLEGFERMVRENSI